ncbi:MAG: hypothetical protein KIT84_16165 [Labilithrix sp.]|nr:hypothetical protein [Labilithrix sp.]
MADKKTHFGRAGEYYGMSELLLRGWNVAVPVVDVGDDVFVIDDNDKTTWRLQVKSAETGPIAEADGNGVKARFKLSRTQLRSLQRIELFYMLLIRVDASWRFLVIPRPELLEIRNTYVAAAADREGPGRRPLGDDTATTDGLPFEVVLRGEDATGWGASLTPYLERWPETLPVVAGGPGTIA